VPQIVGWILIYFAVNPIYLIVSRFFHGVAGGGKLRIPKIPENENVSKTFL
jgi:hypothetical protein